MLKVYEWLVYIIMRPHKSFQHFIKWFDICFIRTTTNIIKKRKERLNRGKRKNFPLAWGEAPLSSRPSPPGLPCRLPPRAAKQLGGAAPTPWSPPRRPGRSRPPRATFSCPGEPPRSRASFPPPLSCSPFLSSFSPSSPRASAVRRRREP